MSPLAALAAALLAGAAPFTAEQPGVRAGNEKLAGGEPAAALERYQEAEREAGAHPEIEFDRGNALYAQGRHAEAREAWKKALEADQKGLLSSRALQNMGNALDAAGDHEGAARAFSDALRRDPANEDARYNLEVLQRRKASGQGKPKDEGNDGKKKDQGAPQGGQGAPPKEKPQGKGGQDQQPGEEKPAPKPGQDERRDAGEERKDQQGQQAAPKAGDRKPGEGGQAGARPDGLGKQDAERLLDALRARERNMPLGPAGRKDGRKRENARDW